MCGIAGIFEGDLADAEYGVTLGRMADALRHRGPDQSGRLIVAELRAGLACRRLSIVDVAGGRQPMSNEGGSVHVVFNGEIYNYPELREQLEARGHRLRTRCDAEVIAHLYEDFALDCLDKLHGMFALAILDVDAGRLVLARDGAGMKSLYWTSSPSGFLFASEAKALLASGLIKAEPSRAAVRTYLTAGIVPAPLTGFEGIEKLPAGGWLVVESGEVRRGQFWSPRAGYDGPRLRDREYADRLESLLQQSVSAHLAADGPVGAFVSGGWDSSLVAHYAAAASSERLKTFSIVFPDDPQTDEGKYSRRMAEHLGSEHHEVEFRSAEVPELLPRVVRQLEEPSIRGPVILDYKLAELAAREVKSVVSGEGADELFGGYGWVRNRALDLGQTLRKVTPPALARFARARIPGRRARRLLDVLAAPDQSAVDLKWLGSLGIQVDDELVDPAFRAGPLPPSALLPDSGVLASCVGLQRRLSLELSSRLADGILVENDKMNMAHSLEARMPFLHRPVLEFALSLPADLKVRKQQEKYILKLLVDCLPPEIAARRKCGLKYPPLMQSVAVQQLVREVLLDSSSPAPFLNRPELEAHLRGPLGDSSRFPSAWKLTVLQTWWNEFLAA